MFLDDFLLNEIIADLVNDFREMQECDFEDLFDKIKRNLPLDKYDVQFLLDLSQNYGRSALITLGEEIDFSNNEEIEAALSAGFLMGFLSAMVYNQEKRMSGGDGMTITFPISLQ